MSSYQTYDPSRDDDDKLLPEWGQSGENQIIWLGLLVAALMALGFFGISRCGGQDDLADAGAAAVAATADSDMTIGEVLADNGDLSSSDELFSSSTYDDDLNDAASGPYTVFAPEDGALADVDLGDLSEDDIDGIAGYHVVEGTYLEADLTEGTELTTLGGAALVVGAGTVLNNGVGIIDADQKATNGVVHTIDGILTDQAAPEPEPTEAPAVAPVEVEPTPVPAEPDPTATPEPDPGFPLGQLASDKGFTGLLAAASAAGIDADLNDASAGPFTVFAPTNAALDAAVPQVSRLGDDAVDEVVRYHVVPGIYMAEDLTPGTELTTVQGETLVIADNGLLNGNIQVVEADLEADNGVMHTVEEVLIPPSIQRQLVVADLNDLFQLEPIQFAYNSAEIQAESFPTLDKAVDILAAAPNGTLVEVGGHTDSDGDEAYNMDLSDRRANSVMTYLTENGVPAEYLVSKGYGETELKVDPEETPEDKAQNRRIEFKILDEG